MDKTPKKVPLKLVPEPPAEAEVVVETPGHTSRTGLIPNQAEAELFLTLLDPEAETFTFQTFDDDKERKKALDDENKQRKKDGQPKKLDPFTRIINDTLARAWVTLVDLNQRGAGVFVTINRTNGKGRKEENITRVRALFVDLDGAPLEPVMRDPRTPHIAVESSTRRYHAYWIVSDVDLADFEAKQKALAAQFNGDPFVHDLPRVMRMPGFVHRKGEPFLTHIIHTLEGAPYEAEAFGVRSEEGIIDGTVEGGGEQRKKGRTTDEIIELLEATRVDGQWNNNMLRATASMVGKGWSDDAIRMACRPYCRDGFTDTDLDGMIDRAREKWSKPEVEVPNWRERYKNTAPMASMHNARLAIEATGVACSYDTFHGRMLFGYREEAVRHVLQLGDEIDDDGILSLRQMLSDRFGFDLTEKHVRDAVRSLALEHCFDPVADMLAEAEASWDGVERLDRVAPDYLNTEDTELNRACVRKWLVAGVARVRTPGCKFDNILVLESAEGWGKSLFFHTMAITPENFSDEQVIGKASREVQESLASVWIYENAELGGLKKTEVEMVKAFASRTVDRARPAYGHFLKNQPRHSIEGGSTNSREYLQSQTGNRRFWDMEILAPIDIEKLREDRLQIWGEAAYYQSRGESLILDETLWGAAGVEQERRRVRDPWEDTLANIPETIRAYDGEFGGVTEVRIVHIVDDEERVSSSDLLTHVLRLAVGQQERRHSMKLSEVMKVLGWRKPKDKLTIEGEQVRGYFRPLSPPVEGE